MKLSFATLGCPAWSIPQIIQNARAFGFDGVELRGVAGEHISPLESPESCARIRTAFSDAGLAIPCIMGYSRLTNDDLVQRDKDIRGIRDMMLVANRVGCPIIRIFGGTMAKDGPSASIARLVRALDELMPYAANAKVRLALETHDEWCRGADMRAVIDRVNSPWLGVCWDFANSFVVEDVEKTFDALSDRIIHVHYKDVIPQADGHAASVLPGRGKVPANRAIQLLQRAGYSGFLSFEWEKKWQPQLPEPEVAFPEFIAQVTGLMSDVGVTRG